MMTAVSRFFYGGVPPSLYASDGTTHITMLMEPDRALIKKLIVGTRFESGTDLYSTGWDSRIRTVAIMGRVSSDKHIVSIWNSDASLVDRLYPDALTELLRHGMLLDDAQVFSPTYNGPKTVNEVISGGTESQAISKEREKELEAMRQMHLARGDEKKNLMRKAGMKIVPGKRPPIATAMQKAGKSSPGQKWWATSESRDGND